MDRRRPNSNLLHKPGLNCYYVYIVPDIEKMKKLVLTGQSKAQPTKMNFVSKSLLGQLEKSLDGILAGLASTSQSDDGKAKKSQAETCEVEPNISVEDMKRHLEQIAGEKEQDRQAGEAQAISEALAEKKRIAALDWAAGSQRIARIKAAGDQRIARLQQPPQVSM